MSDKNSYISQIQAEEQEADKMLKRVDTENEKRVSKAHEEMDEIVSEAEEQERAKAKEQIMQAKETAKQEYGKLLSDEDNKRRDVIENGKAKLSKGKARVLESFMAMFE